MRDVNWWREHLMHCGACQRGMVCKEAEDKGFGIEARNYTEELNLPVPCCVTGFVILSIIVIGIWGGIAGLLYGLWWMYQNLPLWSFIPVLAVAIFIEHKVRSR